MKKALERIKSLLEMTKPKQLALLMITMYGAYFAGGGGFDLHKLLLLTLTGIGSAGGVTALNMYLETDIDSLMPRTRVRPLPRGALSRSEALYGISTLIILGTISGALINKYVALSALIGLYFDIIAYTEIAKRRTEWALLFGSVAGSMPALGGWAAATGGYSLTGILLAGIVYVWQPLHVAFIHYYYEDQYSKAGIPTIPSRLGYKAFANLALFSVTSTIFLVWGIALTLEEGYLTAVIATLLGVQALRAVAKFRFTPGKELARGMIKFASPLVGIIFILLPLELHLFII